MYCDMRKLKPIQEKDVVKTYGIYYMNNIPVRTLYLGGLPEIFSAKILDTCFSKYGEIESVFTRKNMAGYIYSFITFKSPRAAAISFECKQRCVIDNTIVKLNLAHKWHQPYHCKQQLNAEMQSRPGATFTIFNLNDDCLIYMVSYLTIRDQIVFSSICDRFRSICEVVFKRNKKVIFNSDNTGSAIEVCNILSVIGPYVEEAKFKLTFDSRGDIKDILNILSRNCKQIKNLNIINLQPFVFHTFQKCLQKFTSLKSLSVNNNQITDTVCESLQKLTGIESLNLSINEGITGQHLNKLLNLKKLDVSYTKLILSNLILISENTILRELNIMGCDYLKTSHPEEIFLNFTGLEFLNVTNYWPASQLINELTKVKNLRYLKVDCCNKILNDTSRLKNLPLEHLALINCFFDDNGKRSLLSLKNIKCLDISNARGVDDSYLDELATAMPLRGLCVAKVKTLTQSGIISFIRKCPTINEIDISHTLYDFSNFVFAIIDMMLEVKRTKTLTLIGDSFWIYKTIENTSKYKQNMNLVKLCTPEIDDLEPYKARTLNYVHDDFRFVW